MSYTPNIPLANQTLSVSQPYLYANTNAANNIFGVDHYKFDANANNGLHNTVTQPAYQNPIGTPSVTPPDTSAGNPIIYSLNPNTNGNVPVIQFSRGVSNAVPTPLTTLQSVSTPISLTAGSSTNVLDCTGLNLLYGIIYMFNAQEPQTAAYNNFAFLSWDGTGVTIRNFQVGTVLGAALTGNIIQVKNGSASTMTSVYWTFQIMRIA